MNNRVAVVRHLEEHIIAMLAGGYRTRGDSMKAVPFRDLPSKFVFEMLPSGLVFEGQSAKIAPPLREHEVAWQHERILPAPEGRRPARSHLRCSMARCAAGAAPGGPSRRDRHLGVEGGAACEVEPALGSGFYRGNGEGELVRPAVTVPSWPLCGVSYDLLFWKQEAGVSLDPAAVHSSIAEDEPIVGLAVLPIADWIQAVLDAFPDARKEPNGSSEWISWTARDEAESFQVEWSPVHVWVTCRPLNTDIANRLIDIALDLGCPLYDPQTGERFDS